MIEFMEATDDDFLGDILDGMGTPGAQIVAMLRCYYDDAGSDGESPVVTIAGYVATRIRWEQFEKKSNTLFDEYKVKVFHARDFYNTDGEFRGWTRAKKEAFAVKWLNIARRHVICGTAISVAKAKYNETKRTADGRANLPASGLGFALYAPGQGRLAREPKSPMM